MRHFKRWTAAALTAAVLTANAHAAQTSGFSDVPDDHWAAQSVTRCAQYGLLRGVGAGRFGLGESMTRAAYATMLCRLMEWDMISPETGSFADNQDTEEWYYSAIETAYQHGALTGESRLCRPNDPVTREEAAKMTVRALGLTVLSGTAAEELPFTDVTLARGYIALAYHMGIMRGVSPHRFEPKGEAAREQAAVILLRTYDRLHGEIHVSEGDKLTPPTGSVTVQSITEESGSVPVSPRAPMEEVYNAAVQAGEGGSVTLRITPLLQVTRGGAVTETRELTEGELLALLAEGTMREHHSAQHESSCIYRTERDGAVTTVWYEDDEDVAKKVELCRLMGVKNVTVLL